MRCLIEVDTTESFPETLQLSVGDCLSINASGASVEQGSENLELFGPLVETVLGSNGEMLTPCGLPNRILFLAREQGRAKAIVTKAAGFQSATVTHITVLIEP